MKRVLIPLTALVLLLPHAAGASMFDAFYDDVKARSSDPYPDDSILDFVINQMLRYQTRGITLSGDDIKAAIDNKLITGENDGLCQNKLDASGQEWTFQVGTGDSGCVDLRNAILSLVKSETEDDLLGDDLLMAANGSELAVADEPHRPVAMGALSLVLKRIWSGTGTGLIPWSGTADPEFDALEAALVSLSPEDLDAVILRFHFGYFRDLRENDPRFSGIGTTVASKLADVAAALDCTGDQTKIGEFATPSFKKIGNVAFWARKDDLGLQWVYPKHFMRLTRSVASAYPSVPTDPHLETVAYPFDYAGTSAVPSLATPLCSRTVGRQGYLCRRQSVSAPGCKNPNPDEISLVECSVDTKETTGPDICGELVNLYADDGTPLRDPDHPDQINPALTQADVSKICTPETKILYQDGITPNACYIGHCLVQSMNTHTLMPNRNTTLVSEGTSPYLSCIRADPQLGLYSETAHKSPFVLPAYIGHLLVQDFERAYCAVTGDAPRPILSDCNFESDTVLASPTGDQASLADLIARNASVIDKAQSSMLSLVGERSAVDQMLSVNRKLFATMSQFVRQMSDLLSELRRAPLTTVACPWTGPFQKFGP